MPSLDLRDKLQGSDLLIGMRWNSLQNSPRENQLAGESDTTTHTEKHKEMGWSGVCVCVCVCVCGWVDVLGLERQPDKGYFFRETLLQASNG